MVFNATFNNIVREEISFHHNMKNVLMKCCEEYPVFVFTNMPLSTIFHLHRGGQFYLWRTPKYTEKITNLFVEIGNNLHR
jgi:hypothetical protein